MRGSIRVTSRYVVGNTQPDRRMLEDLARQGFRTVVNLRKTAEPGAIPDPEQEGREARNLGLVYIHFPVDAQDLDHETVDRFRDAMIELPGPIFVHCSTGKRSGAFVMMAVGTEEHLSGAEAVRRADQLGLDLKAPDLRNFVETYVETHRE